jgi:hypothetical protein
MQHLFYLAVVILMPMMMMMLFSESINLAFDIAWEPGDEK